MVHWGELWPDALRQAVQEFQGMNYRITDVNGRQHLGPKKGGKGEGSVAMSWDFMPFWHLLVFVTRVYNES